VKCESNIKTKDAREAEEWEETRTNPTSESIVLKPGPADPRLEPGLVEEKTGEGKTQCGPADLATWLTQQDPVANLLTFVFFFY
jgi:hypothetical protein